MLFYPKNIAFGLDIGDRSIKLAELKFSKNIKGKESLVLTSYNEIQLAPGVLVNGEIKNYPAIVQAIETCVKTVKGRPLSGRTVVAGLPEVQCYIKTINFPLENGETVDPDTIHGLLLQHFPAEANELYYDWQRIDNEKIIIGAASKNVVDSYTEVIELAGLIPLSLEIEIVAISRSLVGRDNSNSNEAKILIDLGATHSSIIVIFEHNPILTLNIPLSGASMTEAIAKAQKITFDEAEAMKIKCGADPKNCPMNVKSIINGLINSSTDEIKNSLQHINKILKYKFEMTYVCGGVATMPRFLSALSKKLGVKILPSNPLTNITLDKKIKLTEEEILKYAAAIGLAIRGTEHDLLKLKSDVR